MCFIKKISNFAFSFNAKHAKSALLAALLLAGVSACGDDDDNKATPTGFLKVYNASSDSPAVRISIDENVATAIDLGKSAGSYELDTGSHTMALAYQESDNDYVVINETDASASVAITENQVDLFVISGSITAPVITQFNYADTAPEEGAEVYFINAYADSIDVYLVPEDQTTAQVDAIPLDTLQMSDKVSADLDSYQLHIKKKGSDVASYISAPVAISYLTQYVFIVRESNGPSGSSYTIDELSKLRGAVERPHKDAKAEVRFYNGVTTHDQLPAYSNQLDFTVNELDGSNTIQKIGPDNLLQGAESKTYTVNADEYSVRLAVGATALENKRSLPLGINSDKTVFLYTKTTDEDGAEVRLLAEENSNYNSLYQHNIKMINLVEEHSFVHVFFLKNGQTTSNFTHYLESPFVNTKAITLLNNTYDVLIKSADFQDILYSGTLTFTDEGTDANLNMFDGDLFLVFEKDESADTGYKVTYLAGNDETDVIVDTDPSE